MRQEKFKSETRFIHSFENIKYQWKKRNSPQCFMKRGTLHLRVFMPNLIQEFRGNDEKILVIIKYRCKQLSDCVNSCVIII